jgi:hypothetical protein
LDTLRRTLPLWDVARGLENQEIRGRVLEQREALIREAQEGIVHLGDVFARLQTMHLEGSSRQSIGRLREELDQNLAIAQRVEARIQAWEQEALHRDP